MIKTNIKKKLINFPCYKESPIIKMWKGSISSLYFPCNKERKSQNCLRVETPEYISNVLKKEKPQKDTGPN